MARRNIKQRCRHCNKAIKAGTGLSCSWCGIAYHGAAPCGEARQGDAVCGLGVHSGIIVPPSWILKLPTKGWVESSLKLGTRPTG